METNIYENKKANLTAIVLGATGLVGADLLKYLETEPAYNQVIALVRKPALNFSGSKIQELVIDFNKLKAELQNIKADHLFICIGTTIKKAKTKENFKIVDLDIPVQTAQILVENGCKSIAVVSALGANAKSNIFYNSVKGQMEEAIQQLPFESAYFLRPSLLLGSRSEFRLGERIGEFVLKVLSPLLIGSLKKYKGVQAAQVAKCLMANALSDKKGIHIIENEQILEQKINL